MTQKMHKKKMIIKRENREIENANFRLSQKSFSIICFVCVETSEI